MHTSSGVDNVDEFAETLSPKRRSGALSLRQGDRRVRRKPVTIAFRKPDGTLRPADASRPIARITARSSPSASGKWIATALMWKPVPALEQSFLRTKATDLASYLAVAERKANSSNDTLVRRQQGRDRVPDAAIHAGARRPVRLYASRSTGRTRRPTGRACTRLASLPSVLNPKTGWVRNVNDWPWQAAGPDSPKAANYPQIYGSGRAELSRRACRCCC